MNTLSEEELTAVAASSGTPVSTWPVDLTWPSTPDVSLPSARWVDEGPTRRASS